jgi:hypothetical protein
MIAIALMLSAQTVPQAMLAAADEANGAFVRCLFATSRASHEAGLSVDAFETRLSASCTDEEAALIRATAAVLTRRGQRNAESTARQLTHDARISVVSTYRQTIELSRDHP